MFVNTKNPYMFRSFLFDHPQGAICCALCRYYNVFCWFAFVDYLLGMWLYVYIIYLYVCLVLLSVKDLFVNRSFTDKSTKHTRALCLYYNVFRWFAFVDYLLGMWLYVYIIYVSVRDLLVNRSFTDKSTKHTHK